MTKQEAISKTEYATEDNLIDFAVRLAVNKCEDWRNAASDDLEAWLYYEDLRNAFKAILEDREAKEA